MPLHLLGKKSWNVYNPKNIERVKRDEAAAREREEAEEQRQQEVDSERRLAILRGEVPPPLPPPTSVDDKAPSRKRDRDEESTPAGRGRERRKRKRVGEDDTDFELRLARERTGTAQIMSDVLVKSTSNAPLVDHAGHIDLFPEERSRAVPLKNEEAEQEAAKKKREYEDQYTMRFSNAAGKEGLVGPWYAKGGDIKDIVDGNLEAPSKDVWGNEDPRRKEREAARVVANDPLAMMKRGAAKVREVEKERRQVNEEREKGLKQLLREERRRERRRRREGRDEHDDLEGFSLDGTAPSQPPASSKDHHHHHHHHHRLRRPSRSLDNVDRCRRRLEYRDHRHDDRHRSSRADNREPDQSPSKPDRRR
ncbi:hypothetical protein GGS26DRAFT_408535 [Hypomontagnella submonticulosa]|nr:hypothetical protein GGS26DRAFT_408535 [Hypomontagnella submonticulosa]